MKKNNNLKLCDGVVCEQCKKLTFPLNSLNSDFRIFSKKEGQIIGDMDLHYKYSNLVWILNPERCYQCHNYDRFYYGMGHFSSVDKILDKTNFFDELALCKVKDVFTEEDLMKINIILENYKEKHNNLLFRIFSFDFFNLTEEDVFLIKDNNLNQKNVYILYNNHICFHFCELDCDFNMIWDSIYRYFISPKYIA